MAEKYTDPEGLGVVIEPQDKVKAPTLKRKHLQEIEVQKCKVATLHA